MSTDTEVAPVHVGGVVVYVDPTGQSHNALVTAVWGWNSKEEQDAHHRRIWEQGKEKGAEWATPEHLETALKMPHRPPSLNVVYVESDEKRTDPYGRQLAARATSTVHKSAQPAWGSYWKHPFE